MKVYAVWGSLVLALAIVAAACASSASKSAGFAPDGDDASASGDDATTDAESDAGSFGGGDVVSASTLKIQPADPVVNVTIKDGVVTVMPVAFTALANGTTPVAATWVLDRGDLGPIDAKGVFTASGGGVGKGHVTATYGSVIASTTVTVSIQATQNGAPSVTPDAGVGGVGGNGAGGPVDPGTQGALTGPATPPASAQELGWLYPYDKTVWPHGLLAPLLQWQTTHTASSVYIHLKQKYFEFKGFYSGVVLVNQPLDPAAWKVATNGNTGDPLHVELTIDDGKSVVGPIAEDWTIAPGQLQGTVYYDSYNTQLAPPITSEGQTQSAAVVAVRPGATQPTLALPAVAQTHCVVCHELSADGSTLFSQMNHPPDAYANGASYNLLTGGTQIASYSEAQPAPDGTDNNRKFAWSAVYPDGTFAMAGSNYAREAYYSGPSRLFARSNGNAIATTGWDSNQVVGAMPSFSADGKLLVFNFWSGTAMNGVNPGNGTSLAVVDFDCNAQKGGTTCGAPPFAASNAREIFREPSGSTHLPGWPTFLPNNSFVIFHHSLSWDTGGSDTCNTTATYGSPYNCMFTTWKGAQTELWIVDVPSAQGKTTSPVALDALNGKGYLPTNANHPNDAVLNYEPTVNPIASGGYYWVVFTSRRMYGNVANGAPYDLGDGTYPVPKKLWVAAIDLNPTPGKDPSHPAFYLPGQELNAGNMRGHWVVDPCRANGVSCETGDQCCNGYCRQGDAGGLVCTNQPQGCSQEYEKCTGSSDGGSDCCGTLQCLNGYCAATGVQ
jgi:hypothetical protein